jgi:FAD/FMN-containing dehydrogenase
MYASDASLYRIVPQAVVRPRATRWPRRSSSPASSPGCRSPRGAGTSVAGNAIGPGIVLDFSRHLNRVLEVDPARPHRGVQPGTVHAVLQAAAQAARAAVRARPVDAHPLHDRRDDRQQRVRVADAGVRPHLDNVAGLESR